MPGGYGSCGSLAVQLSWRIFWLMIRILSWRFGNRHIWSSLRGECTSRHTTSTYSRHYLESGGPAVYPVMPLILDPELTASKQTKNVWARDE